MFFVTNNLTNSSNKNVGLSFPGVFNLANKTSWSINGLNYTDARELTIDRTNVFISYKKPSETWGYVA